MSDESEAIRELKARFSDAILEASETEQEMHLTISAAHLTAIALYLRDSPSLGFDYPADLTARESGDQIALWYRLVSMASQRTAILHLFLPADAPEADSVTGIWPGMNWHERECFDLYGVRFLGHPDDGDPAQMRILLPEDWEGHPFRRDYTPVFSGNPLHGPQERN